MPYLGNLTFLGHNPSDVEIKFGNFLSSERVRIGDILKNVVAILAENVHAPPAEQITKTVEEKKQIFDKKPEHQALVSGKKRRLEKELKPSSAQGFDPVSSIISSKKVRR